MRSYRYLTTFAAMFSGTLIITNVLNTKLFVVAGLAFPVGIVTFPLAFLAGDALTEVYGYSVTRRVIWSGFAMLLFMSAVVWLAIQLPPAGFWPHQEAFASLFRQVPRIVAASIIAYASGEFCNSYVLARSKVRTDGRRMWVRFVTSTMAGEAVDTLLFMTIAFLGEYPPGAMLTLFVSSWIFKVAWEVIALPVSVPLVRWLKRVESEDYYDRNTNFNPFRLEG